MTSVTISGSSASSYVPLAVAVATLLGVLLATWAGFRTQRTTRMVEHVTAERAKWRAEVRSEMAKLSAAVVSGLASGSADRAAFTEARVGLLVRVNPQGRLAPQPHVGGHRLDLAIHRKLLALSRGIEAVPSILHVAHVRDCAREDLRLLEHAVQELLKQEWEGSKQEAWLGRIKKPERSDVTAF